MRDIRLERDVLRITGGERCAETEEPGQHDLPDRPLVSGCGWRGAVRVSALPARIGMPLVLTCPAAVSLAMWERHTVQPAAVESPCSQDAIVLGDRGRELADDAPCTAFLPEVETRGYRFRLLKCPRVQA